MVVRTKDRPFFLNRALVDIDAQTFTNYVVVVVNDAGDPEQVDAVIAGAPAGVRARTHVLHRARSVGMEAATNAGLKASMSQYCAIHDDDDLWEPAFLERTVDFLDTNPSAEMVAVRIIIRFEEEVDGEYIETRREPLMGHLQAITIEDLFVTNRVVPIGLLYRRSLHDDVGYFNESLPVVGDWEFNMRVAAKHEIELLDEPLAYWCQRPTAEGTAANSVFGMVARHLEYDLKVRAAAIREDLAQGASTGPYLFQAHLHHEVIRQQERAERQATDHFNRRLDELNRRLDELNRRLDDLGPRLGDLGPRMGDLEDLIITRTNPVHMSKRAVRRILRQSPDQ